MSKPNPLPKEVVCSECWMDWDEHLKFADDGKVRRRDCISVLTAEVERLQNRNLITYTPTYTQPSFYNTWDTSDTTDATIMLRSVG